MTELTKEVKRNKNFILFEIIVWFVVSVCALFYCEDIKVISALIKTVPEYRNVGQVIWQSLFYIAQTVYGITIPVIFVCMIIRYVLYDNKKQQLIKSSMPLQFKTESLFELLNGFIPVIVMYLLRNTLSCIGSYTIVVSMVEQNKHFHVKDFFYMFDELLLVLAVYTLLVISKRVASNVWGMLLFTFLGFFAIYAWYWIVIDFLFDLVLKSLVNIGVYVVMFAVVVLVPLLFLIIKKVDISKGGTYYFKTVHIIVVILSGLFAFAAMQELFKMYAAKINPLFVALSFIVSAGIAAGVWYLTASHHKPVKAEK